MKIIKKFKGFIEEFKRLGVVGMTVMIVLFMALIVTIVIAIQNPKLLEDQRQNDDHGIIYIPGVGFF
ncbi:MAG: hypothetical protein WCL18_11175 [bacterium]